MIPKSSYVSLYPVARPKVSYLAIKKDLLFGLKNSLAGINYFNPLMYYVLK